MHTPAFSLCWIAECIARRRLGDSEGCLLRSTRLVLCRVSYKFELPLLLIEIFL